MGTIGNSLVLSFGVAGFNGAILHLLLKRVFAKSNKIFFGTLFGGMGWKLITLAGLAFYIYGNQNYHLVTTLLAFVFFTTILSFISVWELGTVPLGTVPNSPANTHGF